MKRIFTTLIIISFSVLAFGQVPTISGVTIPTGNYKINDIITLTITASNLPTGLGTSTVNGVTPTNFQILSATTFSIDYQVVSGNTDRGTIGAIPLSIILTNLSGPSTAFTGAATGGTVSIDANAPNNQNTVYPSSTAIQGGGAVTIVSSGTASNQVWFAPAGTTVFIAGATMTQAASGTATSILAPATENPYQLFVIDAAGNISNASTATLTVDNTAPTIQDVVFAASISKQGGASVTIVSSGTASNNVWFAPSGTTVFAAGATMTKATNGTSTTILAPATAGSYKLFVLDAVGNISNASTATLTVDNTPPSITLAVASPSTGFAKIGDIVTITVTAGETLLTQGTSTINGQAITSFLDNTDGTYNLTYTVAPGNTDRAAGALPFSIILTDAAGNNSTARTTFSTANTLAIDANAPNNQNTVYPSSTAIQGGGAVTIVSSGTASNQVWFAPAGTTVFIAGATMTQAASGTSTSILAPATENPYKLFVIDAAGNISNASTATLTVDNTPPTNQDVVFAASISKQGGASVTIVSSGTASNNVWFAPSGTTVFAAGATMTKATNGTSTTILAPATAGSYKLFVLDAVGNISNASTATLTVDNTPPSITLAVASPSTGFAKIGDIVTITVTAGETLLTQGTSTINGQAITSFLDNTDGTYNLTYTVAPGNTDRAAGALPFSIILTDAAGNNSTARTTFSTANTLAIDANAPNNQNTVYPSSTAIQGGGAVTIVSSGTASNQVWFAPAGTTVFIAGATMTQAASGTSTSILAPATENPYKLFVIDAAGNISNASTATLTVDNTPPTAPSAPDLASGSDSGISSTDNITKTTNVTFNSTANVADNIGATIKIFSGATQIGSGAANGSGGYSISATLINANSGFQTITATATDPASNASGSSAVLPGGVNYDTQAPTITGNPVINTNGGSVETIIVSFSETLGITNNTSLTIVAGASTKGFSHENNSVASAVYTTAGNIVTMTSTNNGRWDPSNTSKDQMGYVTTAAVPCVDIAGNELGSTGGNTILTTSGSVPSFNSSLVLFPNGAGAETISFEVDQQLNISSGTAITGLTVSSGTLAAGGAIYTYNAGTSTALITLTNSGANGSWTSATTVSYTGSGNITNAIGSMASFSNEKIIVSTASIASNNAATNWAKTGNTVTVTFTLNKALSAAPTATIDGTNATVVLFSGTALAINAVYKATITTTISTNEIVLPFVLTLTETGRTTDVTATLDDSNVTFDKTSPVVTPVQIISNNGTNTAYAKTGDIITVSYTPTDNLGTITTSAATIAGRTATTSTLASSTLTTDGSEPNGLVTFSVTFTDQAGNSTVVTTVTNASSVTFDKVAPTVSTITPIIANNGPNGISNTTPLTYTVTLNEIVSGLDASDFAITSIPASGPANFPTVTGSVTTVSAGPASSYTVTVASVSGTGQLRLDLTSNGSVIDQAGNANAVSFTTGTTYKVILQEPSKDATNFIASQPGLNPNTSVKLDWKNQAGTVEPTHVLIVGILNGVGSFPTPTDGTLIAASSNWNTAASYGAVIVDLTASYPAIPSNNSYTIDNLLLSGKQYDFKVYPYTLSPNNANNNVDYKTTTVAATSYTVTTASASTIIAGTTAAPATISSVLAGSNTVFSFKIVDDGATSADNAPTTFTNLVINAKTGGTNTIADWTTAIASAQLVDITQNPGSPISGTIGTNTITFASITNGAGNPGYITQNATKEYELRITLKNPFTAIIDNQSFDFTIDPTTFPSSITYGTGASKIASGQSRSTGSEQIIVNRTALKFTTQPAPLSQLVLTDFTTNPVVKAVDGNGNVDVDFTGSTNDVTITNPSSIKMNGVYPLVITPVAGVVTFPASFQYGDQGDGTLTATGGGYNSNSGAGFVACSAVAVAYSQATTITLGSNASNVKLSSLNTTANATTAGYKAFTFKITDDGGAGGDGAPTQFNSLVIKPSGSDQFSPNWDKIIATATLLDVATPANKINGVVAGNTITFSGIPITTGTLGYITDSGSTDYALYISFDPNGTLKTSADQLIFGFSVAKADVGVITASSQIPAGQIQSNGTGNQFEVYATKLAFTTQPQAPAASANYLVSTILTGQGTVPVVEAIDINGYRDRNYSVAVSTTSPVATPSAQPTTISSGLINSFGSMQFTSIGNGTLTVTSAVTNGDTFTTPVIPTAATSNPILVSVGTATKINSPSVSAGSISSITNTTSGSTVFTFSITDDPVGSVQNDGNATKINKIIISGSSANNLITDWSQAIAGARLENAANSTIFIDLNPATDIGTNTLTFNIIPFGANQLGEIQDDQTKTYNLKIWLKSNLSGTQNYNQNIDGKTFGFDVTSSNVFVDATGTALLPALNANTTNVSTPVTVIATNIIWTTIPTTASINTSIVVVAESVDANNNRDINYVGSLTANGNTSGYSIANPPSGSFMAGVLNYPVDNPLTIGTDEGFQFTTGTSLTKLTLSSGAISGTSADIDVKSSFDSWLYFDDTFAYTTRIRFDTKQEASLTNTSNSIDLARLVLSDGGAPLTAITAGNINPGVKNQPFGTHDDIDGAFTRMTSFTVSLTNFNDIRSIAIFDDLGNKIAATEQAAAATVTFSGLNIPALTAADNNVKKFYIRASFKQAVTDLDQIKIQITNVVWNSGSQFPLTPGFVGGIDGTGTGGDESDNTKNYLDVVATKLDFVQQPPAVAGVNQPVPLSGTPSIQVEAHDQFGNLDLDFDPNSAITTPVNPAASTGYNVTVTSASAGAFPSVGSFVFVAGKLNLTNLQYTNAGDGKLTVSAANGVNSNINQPAAVPPNVAVASSAVDVITVYSKPATNGVETATNLAGGAVNKVIYGITFNAPYVVTGKPQLKSFTIGFGDPTATSDPDDNKTPNISTIFKNFKVLENLNGTSFGGSQNVTTLTGTLTINASSVTVTFATPRDFNLSPNVSPAPKQLTYFLQIDVDPSANGSTPPVEPYLKDYGYADILSNNNIFITDGTNPIGSSYSEKITSSDINVRTKGNKYTFAAIFPPVLSSTYPANGQINIDINQPSVGLTFNVPVWSLDDVVYLYDYGKPSPKLILTRSDVNGNATNDGKYPNQLNVTTDLKQTLYYKIPSGTLKNDSVYYIKVAKGVLNNVTGGGNLGVMDGAGNLFPGITSPLTFYFRAIDPIANPNPPNLLNKSGKGIFTQVINATPSGATINATFDSPGTAYYFVVNAGDSPPSSNGQIKGTTTYPTPVLQTGSVVARGNFPINQSDPISQFGSINSLLAPGGVFSPANTYHVYIYSESYSELNGVKTAIPTSSFYGAGPTFTVGAGGPTLTFKPVAASTAVAINNPTYNLCSDSYQLLNAPISLKEGTNKNDFAGAGAQTFVMLLPSGFQFDISTNQSTGQPQYGTAILSGADFSGVGNTINPNDATTFIGTIRFLSNSAVEIKYFNSSNSSLDEISIQGLRIIGNGSSGGSIIRLGGNGIKGSNGILDGATLATISSTPEPTTAANFTNTYSTSNFPGQATVTSIPDNFNAPVGQTNGGSVQLVPTPLTGDYGLTTFSGQGVTGDQLYLAATTLGIPYNLTATHTDNNGCVSVNPVQYLVYDHTNGIKGLNNPPEYCLINSNFTLANTSAQAGSTIRTIPVGLLPGYYLLSVSADLAGIGSTTNQIIGGNTNSANEKAAWQTLLKGTTAAQDPRPAFNTVNLNGLLRQGASFDPGNSNPVPGQTYYNYSFDEAWILNAKASLASIAPAQAINIIDPYLSGRFIKTTAQGQTYYQGGSLGVVEFTAQYQSIANSASVVPIKQNVEFFVPSVPIIEVSTPAQPLLPGGIAYYCEMGGPITINGYPAAAAGSSTGSFAIYNGATLIQAPAPNSAFVDNGNGTATLYPYLLVAGNNIGIKNTYQPITIKYTYQDLKSPANNALGYSSCESTASFTIQITPNPIANFTLQTSAAGVGVGKPSSAVTAFCANNEITFDASSTTAAGSSPKYNWDFGDPNSGKLNLATAVDTLHTFTTSSTYPVSLTVTSNYGCSSTTSTSIDVGSTGKKIEPKIVNVKVGEIPLPKFTFKGNCVTDDIAFDASTSQMPSVGSNSAIAKFIWDFDKMNLAAGNPPVPKTLSSPATTANATAKYSAAQPGFYSVELKAISDVAGTEGCQATNVQQIALLPLVPASSIVGAFIQPFDTDGGWVALDLSGPTPAAGGNSTWNYNATNKNWATATPYKDGEKSALYSACLDLSSVPRPMISFNTDVNVNLGEGLVLQYSKDADTDENIVSATKTWVTLGDFTNGLSSGLDWYKDAGQSGIASIPFNTSGYGWTGATGLIEPRHRLDVQNVAANKRLILRFALGASNTLTAKTGGGISIDNIRVGSRTRTILFENFATTDGGTNTQLNSDLASDASAIATFNTANISSTQVVNINYHIGFIGSDPFNFDNPADPSSRALFYNVSKVPYAFLDGKHSPEYAAANSSNKDLFGQWGQKAYDLQTLQLGKADFTGTKVDNLLDGSGKLTSVKITVKAANTTTVDLPKQTSLFVAVLEPSITLAELNSKVTGAKVTTGETTFPYVLKQMLPNAVGKRINPTGTLPANQKLKAKTGPSLTFDDLGVFEWIPDRIYGTTKEFAVVVFLQNDSTKEVFQAELNPTLTPPATGANPNFSLPSTIITGIETISAENVNFYPNPANQEFTIELPRALRTDANVRMIDQLGQTIDAGVLPTGKNTKTISTFGLASGVYIVEILSDEGSIVRKKVIVVH